ncbi:ATP-binding protein [Sphaerimonospora sp. CA-214678]|uniref:ATP-binding protein n=1 Tax=Sphaerimonospora sp. CA-214678 TaxID=3240029 RepID=UPI003D8A0297
MMNVQITDRSGVNAEPPPDREYTTLVPRVLRAAATIRRHVQGVLAAWGIPRPAAQEALLVISELVTDGILHGLPPIRLRVSLHRHGVRTVMRVEVSSSAAASPPAQPSKEYECGTAVVKALATRCGTDDRSGTITRWADLPAF